MGLDHAISLSDIRVAFTLIYTSSPTIVYVADVVAESVSATTPPSTIHCTLLELSTAAVTVRSSSDIVSVGPVDAVKLPRRSASRILADVALSA